MSKRVYTESYTIPDAILSEVRKELEILLANETFGFTKASERNICPQGWIRYGISVADWSYRNDHSLSVAELASIACLAACNGYTCNIYSWNKAGISIIVAPSGNLKSSLSDRIQKAKELVKPVLENLKGIDSVLSVISVFHDTQHNDYEKCILQTEGTNVSTTSCASDHLHLVLVFDPKKNKDPRKFQWFLNMKSHLASQCERVFGYPNTISCLNFTHSLASGVRYLYLNHKHLLFEYSYQGKGWVRGQKLTWTELHEE